MAALKELVNDMNAGNVDLLHHHRQQSGLRRSAGSALRRRDEQGSAARAAQPLSGRDQRSRHWHINATHYLEQWGDARAIDGTVSLMQPLIAPLYDGSSEYEFIQALLGGPDASGYDIVRATGKAR